MVKCLWVSRIATQEMMMMILTSRVVIASAFTCGEGFSCVTNEDHNVACASGSYEPFFTVCLDHEAFLDGACDDAQSLTGCW